MKDNFDKRYFQENHDYPDDEDKSDMEKLLRADGICCDYVGHDVMDSYLQKVIPVSVYGIHRYDNPVDNIAKAEAWNSSEVKVWPKGFSRGIYSDDILILGKDENDDTWWFAWIDRDSSDCCIGHFRTLDSEEVVKIIFGKYCYKMSSYSCEKYQGIKDQDAIKLAVPVNRMSW